MKKMCNFAAERGQAPAPRAGHTAAVICGAGRAHTSHCVERKSNITSEYQRKEQWLTQD